MIQKIYQLLIGAPRSPLDKKTRQKIALTALLAWVGLGADGLSSSCYGPEEGFLALGAHTQLALYLALATGFTVFIISFAYNQVIALFPNGGGGYKVATKLLGKYPGVVVGAALIVDYMLTIVISVASGADAIFSLLPLGGQLYKLPIETVLILILMVLNLRGMKESIRFLLPIFIGFVILHLMLITYGIAVHGKLLPVLLTNAVEETHRLTLSSGLFFTLALFLRAYSLGGGTYTGLEAVSNNVNKLAEPRVQTGKWTMFYMAVSLSVTAGGIILLYLLWQVTPQPGQTLNAVVFSSILKGWHFSYPILFLTLIFEAGLLFLSANTGFMGGPAVLANMAMDSWMPNRFRNLSSRLVTQNGVILFGISAIIILYMTGGSVYYLVVLYSINVFLAFALSLLGLCCYWLKHRKDSLGWKKRLALSLIGTIICFAILLVTVTSKFTSGGWVAVAIMVCVVSVCLFIRRHYEGIYTKLQAIDQLLTRTIHLDPNSPSPIFNAEEPTAIFLLGKSRGAGLHTLLWVQRLFPDHFKNFVFISVGVVDVESYGGDEALAKMQKQVEANIRYFEQFSQQHGIAAQSVCAYGTDPVEKLSEIALRLSNDLPQSIFFASQLVLEHDNWLTRGLHNETAFAVQRKLHLYGIKLVILPMKIELNDSSKLLV